MTTQTEAPESVYAAAAGPEGIDRTARALVSRGFRVEILDDAQAARARVAALLPDGAAVFTAASETLRLSGIESDIERSDRLHAIKPRVRKLDRSTQGDEIRRLTAISDVVVGIVSDLTAALHRVETYAYPLEDVRPRAIYGRPSAINKLLIVNAEPYPGRTT